MTKIFQITAMLCLIFLLVFSSLPVAIAATVADEPVVVGKGCTTLTAADTALFKDAASIVVAEGVQVIKSGAFEGFALSSITLPESLQMIEQNAFSLCGNLTFVHLPAGVVYVEAHAFVACTALETVTYDNEEMEWEENSFPASTVVRYSGMIWDPYGLGDVATAWIILAVIFVVIYLGLIIVGVVMYIVLFIANITATSRYYRKTGESGGGLYAAAVLCSLFGFGLIYLIIIAVMSHSAKPAPQYNCTEWNGPR